MSLKLVRGDPIIVGYGVVREIGEQLLQRRVLGGERIGRRGILPAVGVGEEHHGIVLGGVIELVGAVERVEIAGGKNSRVAGDRHCPLRPRQGDIGEIPGAIHGQIYILLIGLPGFYRLG